MKREQERIAANKVVVYGKGTKLMPMCGFTGQVVSILRDLGTAFEMVNILEDDELRSGMKEFSDWPTFPQVYIDGEFVGGADIISEMYESGELSELVNKTKD